MITYNAFDKQAEVHLSQARRKFVHAGKRGSKTWLGAIETILKINNKPNFTSKNNEPYKVGVAAPTFRMLRTLPMNQILSFGKGLIKEHNKSNQEIIWRDGSIIYGLSADRPQRSEGLKLNFVWIDEAFQVSEQFFLEMLARTTDTRGHILCTSSLGVQYRNPKKTWCYQYAHESPLEDTEVFEWPTSANPHIDRKELLHLKDTLDPRTYRQMFEVDWNVPGTALVFNDISDGNFQKAIQLKPEWEISVAVDWGHAHPMAALFVAYEKLSDTVYVFDEIVKSRMKRWELYDAIMAKKLPVKNWYCDIAGKKETEETDFSNVKWFRSKGIQFKYKRTEVVYGISLMRPYMLNGAGQRKLIIDELRCPKLVDQLLNYRYPTDKNDVITNENPVKENDDAIDALRYYFVNRLDRKDMKTFNEMDRWKIWQYNSRRPSSKI